MGAVPYRIIVHKAEGEIGDLLIELARLVLAKLTKLRERPDWVSWV